MEEFIEIVRDYPLEKYSLASGATLVEHELAAVNSDGNAVRAADTSGLKVRGVAKIVRNGAVEIVCGIFRFKNDTTHALTRAYAGKVAYVKDHETVASENTNGIVAGLVVDVTGDGVYVDLRLPALATAQALAGLASLQATVAGHTTSLGTLGTTVAGHTTAIEALQAAE